MKFLLILLSLGLTMPLFSENSSLSTQQQTKAVEKLLDEVWSKGNIQVVDTLIAPQYTIQHDPGDAWEGKTLDLATYKKRVQQSRKAFPDQKFYIDDILSQGNKVAVSWHFTGSQKGTIANLPTTNKKVRVAGITIYYFDKGKITGHWQIVDRLGFLQQIGLFKKKAE